MENIVRISKRIEILHSVKAEDDARALRYPKMGQTKIAIQFGNCNGMNRLDVFWGSLSY